MDERDFAAEIETARGDPAQLRKLASEMQSSAALRPLILKAIHLARQADQTPHPLGKLGRELGLPKPDGQPLYRYKVSAAALNRIEQTLKTYLALDPGSSSLAPLFVLWAADWFRRSYQGGMQKWDDIGKALNIRLPWANWAQLADRGLEVWKIPPLVTAHGKQRLANIARQGGFPAAAISGGATWPRKFLERVVGELLGSDPFDIQTAIEICERNELLIPQLWRSPEMQAICGELAVAIVELRQFADLNGAESGLPYSVVLDRTHAEWRDELPLRLDGAANSLIDTLLAARRLQRGGSIRVERIVKLVGDTWNEGLELHLDGFWEDKDKSLAAAGCHRAFLQPAGALADRLIGRLGYLENEDADRWIVRQTCTGNFIEFPFSTEVLAELQARGVTLSTPTALPGGKPVGTKLHLFENKDADQKGSSTLSLIGQGSGAYRPEVVLLDVPAHWTVTGTDGKSAIEEEDEPLASGRKLYSCAGEIKVRDDFGDTFLIRTGQTADRKDRLSVFGTTPTRLLAPAGASLVQQPIQVRIEDGVSSRTAQDHEVCWRFQGEAGWRNDVSLAGPGPCEFGWLDKDTGHLRAKDSAVVLPQAFLLSQIEQGGTAVLNLQGWEGSARVKEAEPSEGTSWQFRIDPPRRALVTLELDISGAPIFELHVPLRSKEWVTRWDGELVPARSVLGLADLSEVVARVPTPGMLMADLPRFVGASLEARWQIKDELGLSAVRSDIANLIRPLGIDAHVKLNFHNGSEDYWFVTEFGNWLEQQPAGDLVPRSAIVAESALVCGRSMAAPEKEVVLGPYEGAASLRGAGPVHLPRLRGPWLVYIREGTRILTRPLFISGDEGGPAAQHHLGRCMAQPIELARQDLHSLVDGLQHDPLSEQSAKAIAAILDLAVSLDGLPPQTFEIFNLMETAPIVGPLMLYRCEEKHLAAVLSLVDGLAFSWVTLQRSGWDAAFEAQGRFLLGLLDNPEWVVTHMTARQTEVAARLPQLAAVISRNFEPATFGQVWDRFSTHTSEGIDSDAASRSPFREDFAAQLPDIKLAPPLLRVFDAPFAAALTANGKATLNQLQKLTIKDVERRHPEYFAMAFGHALWETASG